MQSKGSLSAVYKIELDELKGKITPQTLECEGAHTHYPDMVWKWSKLEKLLKGTELAMPETEIII